MTDLLEGPEVIRLINPTAPSSCTGPLPPGRCKPEDLVRLAQLTRDKDILMIGAYCGRGAAAVGLVCKSLMVVEDFQGYPGEWSAYGQEFMRVCKDYDNRTSLLMKRFEQLSEEELGKYDVIYVDADYSENIKEALDAGISSLDSGKPGILIWHNDDGALESTEVNWV